MTTSTKTNIGKRFGAGFVDYLIIFIFFFVYVYAFGSPNDQGGYTISGLPALVPIIFWFVMTVGLEQLFGATIGNSLFGLKPVSVQGFRGKLSFGQSFKRHLLDPVDMFFFGLIAYITITKSEKHQRVGDMWAGTIVIQFNENEK